MYPYYMPSSTHYEPSFDHAAAYSTTSPKSPANLDIYQQMLFPDQHKGISHDHGQRPSRFNTPSDGMGPDPEFVQSLHSIRATDPIPRQRCIYGASSPTKSEAVVADTIVRARKSWKTVKGRSEPVWPPELEKALVQALLNYRPNDAQFSRALGRFPKRNRFISDYIYAVTGVRRTPKQVGSRLQQLKDVSCGKMLLNHVASWSQTSSPPGSEPAYNDDDVPRDSKPDLDAIFRESQLHSSISERTQAPVIPLTTIEQESFFSPISASSAELHRPYPIHLQYPYPQESWYIDNQCLPAPAQL